MNADVVQRWHQDFSEDKDGRKIVVEIKGQQSVQDFAKYYAARMHCFQHDMEFCIVHECPVEPLTAYLQ